MLTVTGGSAAVTGGIGGNGGPGMRVREETETGSITVTGGSANITGGFASKTNGHPGNAVNKRITMTGRKCEESEDGSTWTVMTGNTSTKQYVRITTPTEYPLWIGDTQVRSDRLSGEGWDYDVATNTLTLKGAKITTGRVYAVDHKCGIYYNGLEPLSIVLKSGTDNIIKDVYAGIVIYSDDVDLTISGEESLTAHLSGIGMLCYGNVTINNGAVSVSGYDGIHVQDRNVTINGGTVNATGSRDNGIFGKNVTINGGMVTAEGGSRKPAAIGAGRIRIGTDLIIKAGSGKDDAQIVDQYDDEKWARIGKGVTRKLHFIVKNGAWNDGGKNTRTVSMTGFEDEVILTADQIPEVGGKPDSGYMEGSWDVTPVAGTLITKDTDYTYTYAQKGTATVTKAPAVKNLTYTGSAQELVTAGVADGGTMNYAIGESAATAPATGWGPEIPKGTDAGTYYVWYKAVGDQNHSDSGAACQTATIAQASIADATVTLSATVLDYTGAEQKVTVTGVKLGDRTLTEETDYDVSGETAGTNRGTYTVTVTGKGNYKDSATGKWGIGLITPTITSVPTASAITYGQTLKDSVLAGGVAKAGDTVVEGTFEWKKPGTAPAVSDSEVTAYEAVFIPKDTEIFWMAECGVTLTVNKANSTPATVTANNRSYDGKKEPLVTVDESTLVGGMMAYALGRNAAAAPDASAYTAAIPKDDGAGTYYVWYCVRGDENHLDSAAACVTVKIASQEKPGGRVLPKLEPKGNNALKLSWTKMTHVDGYDIYFTDGDKSFKKTPTASVDADVSEYVFKGLKKKSIHKAYVRAYVMEKGEKSYVSDRMDMISIVGGSSDDYTVPAKVKAKDLKLAVGAKQKIKPTVVGKDSKKKVLSLNKGRLYYISLDPSIAKVSDDGTVRAVKEGTARILVIACNGVRTTVKVTVGQGPDKLSFGKKKYTVKAGKTIDLYKLLKISPKNAMVSLTWKSSNKKIATVNEKGVVTGVKKGTVTITVTDASGVKTTVKIEVKKAKK